MLQLNVRRGGQKPFWHQSLQLLSGIGRCVHRIFSVLYFALGDSKFQQNACGQARNFSGN